MIVYARNMRIPLVLIPETRGLVLSSNNRCLVSRLVQRIYKIGVRRLFSPVARPESMQKRTRENSNVLLHTIFLFHLPRLCNLTGRQDNVRVHIWVPVLR